MARDRHGHENAWRERELERQRRLRPNKRASRKAVKAVQRFGDSLDDLAELAGADPCTCGRKLDPECPVHCPPDEVIQRELEAKIREQQRMLDEVAQHARRKRAMQFAPPARIFFMHPPGGGKSFTARQMFERMLAADPHAKALIASTDPKPKDP